MSEELKKKFEDSETKRTELESQVEELKRSPPESTEQQSAISDLQTLLDKTREVRGDYMYMYLYTCTCMYHTWGQVHNVLYLFIYLFIYLFVYFKELEASKTAHETLSASLAEKEDKMSRIIKTARSLKLSKEQIKNEKDNIEKELEEAKGIPLPLSLSLSLSLSLPPSPSLSLSLSPPLSLSLSDLFYYFLSF